METKNCEFCYESFDVNNEFHVKKCQGCKRSLSCKMFEATKKRCNCCAAQRLKPKSLCRYSDCKTRPNYGKKDSNLREFCKRHAPLGYIDIASKKCKNPGCNTVPVYGKKDSNLREFCKAHSPEGYVDVVNKKCKFPGCDTLPHYGLVGSTTRDFCKKHSSVDHINIVNKKCGYPGCAKFPSYGQKGSFVKEFCKDHMLEEYVLVSKKDCKYEGCNKCPTYGKKGSNAREFCSEHAHPGYVDVSHKKCAHIDCDTIPTYGKKDSVVKEFCQSHAPQEYVVISGKKCDYDGCNTRPSFSKKDSAECFCKKHSDATCVDIIHSICQKCDTRATYAFPSVKNTEQTRLNKPTHCLKHKQIGMIIIKRCLAKTCKNSALYGTITPIHCEEHKNDNDIDLIERECKECSSIGTVDDNGICWAYCVPTTIHNKQHKKHQTAFLNYEIQEILK